MTTSLLPDVIFKSLISSEPITDKFIFLKFEKLFFLNRYSTLLSIEFPMEYAFFTAF